MSNTWTTKATAAAPAAATAAAAVGAAVGTIISETLRGSTNAGGTILNGTPVSSTRKT